MRNINKQTDTFTRSGTGMKKLDSFHRKRCRDRDFLNLLEHNEAIFGRCLDTHMLIKDMQECFQGLSVWCPAAFSALPVLPPCRFVIHINESNQASNQGKLSLYFIFYFTYVYVCVAFSCPHHSGAHKWKTGIGILFKVLWGRESKLFCHKKAS